MSKIQCTCGESLRNSSSPSPNLLTVFSINTVQQCLHRRPDITLFEFETEENERDYEYWYCPQCKRVHIVENIPMGNIVKHYVPVISGEAGPLDSVEGFYVFTNTEIYDAEEIDFNLTLASYVARFGPNHTFFYAPDTDSIYKPIDEDHYELFYTVEE